MNTLKTALIVLSAPVILLTCFSTNVIKSKDLVRKPAIDTIKPYHFNKSLLVLATTK
jgi:hypothetical protein